MLTIQTFTFNPFLENTYVVSNGLDALIIDPGCYEAEEKSELDQYILDNKLIPKLLVNTHCHIDHVLGNHYIKEKYKIPLVIHEYDLPVLKSEKSYAPNYGFHQYSEALPDSFLNENDSLSVGNSTLKILFLPGHSPGHIGLYFEKEGKLLSGDVLFYQSIGRTDLPGGDSNLLISSIQKKIFILPDEVVVYPGHGQTTTIGFEKNHNPFCALPKKY